jgi:apolipoprotein N-acyltransferase
MSNRDYFHFLRISLLHIYQAVVISWGWQRTLLSLFAGALGALSLAPFGFFPALVLSMVLAVWLLDGATMVSKWGTFRVSFITGWWFGFGYFLAGLWWLGAAFLVEADRFAWALPLGVVALPAGLALFHAFAFAFARLMWSAKAGRILALVSMLAAADWLRGHILTGFPWNVYGMALGEHLWTAQIASVVGVYGVGVFALFIAAAPASLVTERGFFWRPTLAALVLLVGLMGFGLWRIPSAPMPSIAKVKLRIMQPNVQQDAKFRPENREEIMRKYLSITDRATSPQSMGVSDATHVIWPESAFPFVFARDARALAQIKALLPAHVTLITGAASLSEGLSGEAGRYRNSIHVVTPENGVVDTYDKVRLVPFGEYLPLADTLMGMGIRQLANLPEGFTVQRGFEAGERRKFLQAAGLPPIIPLICYEAIFAGEIRPNLEKEPSKSASILPGLLLNVTNDAWFGNTPGPYQHFSQTRLRAIEEGLPLVRAANSGISAVVDPYGRIVHMLRLGIEGVIDSHLPKSLNHTIYSYFKDIFFLCLILVCLLGAVITAWRR